MSSSQKIEFAFEHLRSEVDEPKEFWQLLLRINADFSIVVGNRIFYTEPDFPLVEFASQALNWSRKQGSDFLYTSMESEEEPLIGFYLENDRFRAYSPHQEFQSASTIEKQDLLVAISSLAEELRLKVKSELAIELDLENLSERWK